MTVFTKIIATVKIIAKHPATRRAVKAVANIVIEEIFKNQGKK